MFINPKLLNAIVIVSCFGFSVELLSMETKKPSYFERRKAEMDRTSKTSLDTSTSPINTSSHSHNNVSIPSPTTTPVEEIVTPNATQAFTIPTEEKKESNPEFIHMAQAAQQQQSKTNNNQKNYSYVPENTERPEISVLGDPKVTITNFRNPFMIHENLHTPGKDPRDEEIDTKREAYLRALRENEEQKHAIAFSTSDQGRKQKSELLAANQEFKLEQLKLAKTEAGQEVLQHEIDVAVFKQTAAKEALKKVHPLDVQKTEAKEEAEVKFEANKHLQNLAIDDKLQNFEREKKLAEAEGETGAARALAQKKYLNANDPDRSIKGMLYFLVLEEGLRRVAQKTVNGIEGGIYFAWEKSYEFYKQLPLEHARRLKERDNLIKEFQVLQKNYQMQIQEKNTIQNSLEKDSILINQTWKDLKRIKILIQNTTDEDEKKQLQMVYDMISQQWIGNIIKKNTLLKLNVEQQPQFQRLLAEKNKQMKKQQKETATKVPITPVQPEPQTPSQALHAKQAASQPA